MFGLFKVVEDYLSKGTSNNASLFEEGGGVESDNFILKRIIKDKGVVYAKSHESEVDGIGWIPSGETVYNKDGINIKVDSVQDIAHYADISLSDGVWTYTPSEEGAEIQYYIHTTHTANGNLVFTVYDFIVEWSDEFKYDEDGNKVDTFGIDLLEQDCQKINSENGLGEFNTQTNFQLYKYQNKFIEDESEKIYADGGGVKGRRILNDNEYKAVLQKLQEIYGIDESDKVVHYKDLWDAYTELSPSQLETFFGSDTEMDVALVNVFRKNGWEVIDNEGTYKYAKGGGVGDGWNNQTSIDLKQNLRDVGIDLNKYKNIKELSSLAPKTKSSIQWVAIGRKDNMWNDDGSMKKNIWQGGVGKTIKEALADLDKKLE